MTRTLILLGLAVLPVLACGCGQSGPDGNILIGKMTLDGRPVQFATVYASGPDNAEASGPVERGSYVIRRAPVGRLRFRVVGVPPPPPDRQVPPGAMPGTPIPAKYQSTDNELTLDYRGGRQTFDVTLQP